jgi:hypothetical protein
MRGAKRLAPYVFAELELVGQGNNVHCDGRGLFVG